MNYALPAGFYPYAAATETDATELGQLARRRVHWQHARLVLRHHHPNLHDSILQSAYRSALIAHSAHGELDPRLPGVFNPDLSLLWGQGVWHDSRTLRVTEPDNDTVDALPHVQDVLQAPDGT